MQERLRNGPVAVVSPDPGGVERARAFAKRLDATLAIIDKRRARANEVAEMRVVGDVEGQTAVIVDDIVDTAGTLATAAAALREAGANEVIACCTHPVLSGPAIERIASSTLTSLVVTDTDSACGRKAAGVTRSKCCRWPACSPRRSAGPIARSPSARCSFELA